jgi:hypothetical protein
LRQEEDGPALDWRQGFSVSASLLAVEVVFFVLQQIPRGNAGGGSGSNNIATPH